MGSLGLVHGDSVESGEATQAKRLSHSEACHGRGGLSLEVPLPSIEICPSFLCFSSTLHSPSLALLESCQLGVIMKKDQREGSGFRGLQGKGRFCG